MFMSSGLYEGLADYFATKQKHFNRFLQEGETYTRGFLDSYWGIRKLWARINCDARYLAAQEALFHFEKQGK